MSNEKSKHKVSVLTTKIMQPADGGLNSSLAPNDGSVKRMTESKSYDRDTMVQRLTAAGVINRGRKDSDCTE